MAHVRTLGAALARRLWLRHAELTGKGSRPGRTVPRVPRTLAQSLAAMLRKRAAELAP